MAQKLIYSGHPVIGGHPDLSVRDFTNVEPVSICVYLFLSKKNPELHLIR